MKTIKYTLIAIIALLCWQCNDEDPLDSELGSYRRKYDVNSPDTVVRFVSQYYQRYGKVFITDPDSSDYLYNFQYKNTVKLKMPEQETEHLLYGIAYMNELFVDFYPDQFIKEHFPFSLIISDSIYTVGFGAKEIDLYVARNFLALNVGQKTRDYTFEEKKHLSLTMHITFITDLLYQYQNCLDLSAFFAPSEKLYSTIGSSKLSIEQLYAQGIMYDRAWYGNTEYPSRKDDLKDWLSFLTGYKEDKWSKIPDNVDELIATYPVMKQKYDALTQAIKDCIGIDYKELIYKEK